MTFEITDPADDLTIIEANDDFSMNGFDAQLAAVEGGRVRCFSCRADSAADEFRIEALRRTEGASDPADMVANVAVQCPRCGAKGVLTLAYGPEASAEDQDVLSILDDARDTKSGGTSV